MKRVFLIWLACGTVYMSIEIAWRGYTHPSMFIVGGVCGVLVGMINQHPRFYRMRIILQSVIGACIVLMVELAAGVIINLRFGLGVWDYSDVPGNILGQICVQYGILWLLLMPFAIWLEDTARWLIYSWDKLLGRDAGEPPIYPPYTIAGIYMDFFTGK